MRKILLSLVTVLAVGAMTTLATRSVFSSTATVQNNTFSTGTLQIRVNGQSVVQGFTLNDAVPGTCKEGTFTVQNYGAPWFAGPSTLNAKELNIKTANFGGDAVLYNALTLEVGADRGWGSWMPVYTGNLNALTAGDLLDGRWTELAHGDSEIVHYNVCLPVTAGDDLQGKTATFDFVVDAYNPHR